MDEVSEFESIFKKHISSGHLEKAIDLGMSFYCDIDSDSYNDFVNLSGRFKNISASYRDGTILYPEYELLHSRIQKSAIELIESYRKNVKYNNFKQGNNFNASNNNRNESEKISRKTTEARSYVVKALVLYKEGKKNDVITNLKHSCEIYKNIIYKDSLLQRSTLAYYDVISIYFALWGLDEKNRDVHSEELLTYIENIKRIDIDESEQKELANDYIIVKNELKFLKIADQITGISFLTGLFALSLVFIFPKIDIFSYILGFICIIFVLSGSIYGGTQNKINKICMKRIY